jgi:hypothetical protein
MLRYTKIVCLFFKLRFASPTETLLYRSNMRPLQLVQLKRKKESKYLNYFKQCIYFLSAHIVPSQKLFRVSYRRIPRYVGVLLDWWCYFPFSILFSLWFPLLFLLLYATGIWFWWFRFRERNEMTWKNKGEKRKVALKWDDTRFWYWRFSSDCLWSNGVKEMDVITKVTQKEVWSGKANNG